MMIMVHSPNPSTQETGAGRLQQVNAGLVRRVWQFEYEICPTGFYVSTVSPQMAVLLGRLWGL